MWCILFILLPFPHFSVHAGGSHSSLWSPCSLCLGCTSVWSLQMTKRMSIGKQKRAHEMPKKSTSCCFWLYIFIVLLRKGFIKLKHWVNWFMVLIIISAVLTSYCVLLLVRIHTNWLKRRGPSKDTCGASVGMGLQRPPKYFCHCINMMYSQADVCNCNFIL